MTSTEELGSLIRDDRRHPVCRHGQIVYSARIDNKKILMCQRVALCAWCASKDVAERTFLDVFSNAVVVNAAFSYCCCMYCDNVRTVYFDRPPFRDAVTPASCCNPFPHPCLHCCGICGDALVFRGGIHGCPELGVGHCCGYVGMCFFPFNIFYGLASGEAEKTAIIINRQVTQFRTSGGLFIEAGYAKLMS